jgi:ribosomal protein L28
MEIYDKNSKMFLPTRTMVTWSKDQNESIRIKMIKEDLRTIKNLMRVLTCINKAGNL